MITTASQKNLKEFLTGLRLSRSEAQAEILSEDRRRSYLLQHFDRFTRTVELVRRFASTNKPLKVLDVGGFPYYLPVMLVSELAADVSVIDLPKESYWPGAPYTQTRSTVTLEADGEQFAFPQQVINIEYDVLKEKDAYDVVVFTEILEHLVLQPHHALAQIHQVLKPGGILVLSTPNAQYLMKVLAMIRGKNLYERYNLTLGAYGRHNREYLLSEVVELLETLNFKIAQAELVNLAKDHLSPASHAKYRLVDALTNTLFRQRRENIFVVGQKHGKTVMAEPETIFRR